MFEGAVVLEGPLGTEVFLRVPGSPSSSFRGSTTHFFSKSPERERDTSDFRSAYYLFLELHAVVFQSLTVSNESLRRGLGTRRKQKGGEGHRSKPLNTPEDAMCTEEGKTGCMWNLQTTSYLQTECMNSLSEGTNWPLMRYWKWIPGNSRTKIN